MARVEKTVFISYRRDHGGVWARAIYQDLVANGYDAFFDFQSINSGDFSRIIIENIKARAHFLVLLAPSALERCEDPDDWLRREIETAIDHKRNIVPILLESFDFGNPDAVKVLTGKLATLKKYNGLRIYAEYFEEGMVRLRNRYLNTALDAVLHPVSQNVQRATKEQQFAASNAQPVKQKELTANEWFEKGLSTTDLDEKIRYYSEAIRLKPDYAQAYNNRAVAYNIMGNIDAAIKDCADAIRINPKSANPQLVWGNARRVNGDLDGAIKNYTEAIRLKSDYADAYICRGQFKTIKKLFALNQIMARQGLPW
jgi:tetratricopeptide (TPR) repeat protein